MLRMIGRPILGLDTCTPLLCDGRMTAEKLTAEQQYLTQSLLPSFARQQPLVPTLWFSEAPQGLEHPAPASGHRRCSRTLLLTVSFTYYMGWII